MRMRRKKHGAERIAACADLLIQLPQEQDERIDPGTCYPNSAPVFLEIGCGKGGFAAAWAAKHQDANLLAVERVADVACIALEKAKAAASDRPRDNLRFLIGNAETLSSRFEAGTFAGIYLNFSDPWPKKGYAKRRLTHTGFLDMYRCLLAPQASLFFKTDDADLFDYSLTAFEAAGLTIVATERDLHHSPLAADNIMTEYEQNFVSQGKPICYAQVRFS